MNIYDIIADNPTINVRLDGPHNKVTNKPDMKRKLSSTLYL